MDIDDLKIETRSLDRIINFERRYTLQQGQREQMKTVCLPPPLDSGTRDITLGLAPEKRSIFLIKSLLVIHTLVFIFKDSRQCLIRSRHRVLREYL